MPPALPDLKKKVYDSLRSPMNLEPMPSGLCWNWLPCNFLVTVSGRIFHLRLIVHWFCLERIIFWGCCACSWRPCFLVPWWSLHSNEDVRWRLILYNHNHPYCSKGWGGCTWDLELNCPKGRAFSRYSLSLCSLLWKMSIISVLWLFTADRVTNCTNHHH